MAGFTVTGPGLIYAGVGGTPAARTPLFLGTAESDIEIEFRVAKIPVFNSLTGKTNPADEIYDGEIAFINFVLNRFNHAVANRMMAQPDFTATPGLNRITTIGTLLGSEGFTYPIWIVNSYSGKFAATSGVRAGYRFFSCSLEAPKRRKIGTKEEQIPMVIKAMPWLSAAAAPNPATGPSVPTNSVINFSSLYDADITATAGIPAA